MRFPISRYFDPVEILPATRTAPAINISPFILITPDLKPVAYPGGANPPAHIAGVLFLVLWVVAFINTVIPVDLK